MATWQKRDRTGEPVQISNVVAGDQIDFFKVLSGPANTVQIYTGSDTATVNYRVNNRELVLGDKSSWGGPGPAGKVARAFGVTDAVEVWRTTTTFDSTGSQIQLGYGYPVSSLEIVSISGTSSLTIICW